MSRRAFARRSLLWFAAALMMLRAAMPLLATASATLHGVPLAEVCTVYGVALKAPEPAGDPWQAPATAVHGGGDCVLAALAAMHVPPPALDRLPVATTVIASVPATRSIGGVPDPSARWLAHLLHAPPRSS